MVPLRLRKVEGWIEMSLARLPGFDQPTKRTYIRSQPIGIHHDFYFQRRNPTKLSLERIFLYHHTFSIKLARRSMQMCCNYLVKTRKNTVLIWRLQRAIKRQTSQQVGIYCKCILFLWTVISTV